MDCIIQVDADRVQDNEDAFIRRTKALEAPACPLLILQKDLVL